MKKIRHNIEIFITQSSRIVYRHPMAALCFVLLTTLIFSLGFVNLYIDVTPENMLGEANAARLDYEKFRQIFDNDEVAIVIVQADDVFDPTFLKKLASFQRQIENSVPYIDQLDSLISARLTQASDDDLVVNSLKDEWPTTLEAFSHFKQKILANPVYKNVLYSEDHHFTTIRINIRAPWDEADKRKKFSYNLLEVSEVDEMVPKLFLLMKELETNEGIKTWLTGGPPTGWSISKAIERDMSLFTGLAVVMIGLLLACLFRRVSGVIIPLLIVVLSLLGTFGFMGLIHYPIAAITQILPTLLITVGVAEAVHVLSLFYTAYDKGVEKEKALIDAYRHCGVAILMTSLTTAGGLVSFYFADLIPIAQFGVAAPMGVMLALLYTIVLLPAIIAIVNIKRKSPVNKGNSDSIDRALIFVSLKSTEYPKLVIAVWTALVAVSLFYAVKLEFIYQPSRMLNESHPVREAVEIANNKFKWGTYIDILIDTNQPQGLYDPINLSAVNKIQQIAEQTWSDDVIVANSSSVADLVKEINRSLHADREGYYSIPNEKALIAQELLLFELSGSEDMRLLVDDNHQIARITLLLPDKNILHFIKYVEALTNNISQVLPAHATLYITGIAPVVMEAFSKMLKTMAQSNIIALIIIFPLMIILLDNIKYAAISMIPNIAPIVVGLGVMHLFEIPLDIFTILIGSIIIGIAVDDTIHFMHSYKRIKDTGVSVTEAIHATIMGCGRALLITSLSLACGFGIFGLATMDAVQSFGFISALTIVIAILSDVSLTPALLTLLEREGDQLAIDNVRDSLLSQKNHDVDSGTKLTNSIK